MSLPAPPMPLAGVFSAGDIPVSAGIGILATLLMLAGVLVLFLLAALWRQRRRLETVERAWRGHVHKARKRRETERRIGSAGHVLRDISAGLPAAVFSVRQDRDRRMRVDYLAGDLHALFGIDAQDLPASGDHVSATAFHERVHPRDRDALDRCLRRTVRDARPATLDFRAYGVDGLRWLRLTTTAQRRGDGSIHRVGYVGDTTSLNTRNQVLQAARDAAERASRAKADFLATMSHEIRTPMNGVIGMLELLGHTPLDADQRGLLQAVEDSAGVLLQILNDVLDFSKLEAGSLRLDPAPFDPRVLVDNTVALVAGSMRQKGLDVAVAMDATLAGRLHGDDVRLRQILLNLLNNACKFTERGSVAVALRVLGDDGGRQRLSLSVADTGIGIPADRQATLFAPFAQAESWTARRHGGTGLGLAICRYLVQLMDGRIELASEPGAGTTVTLELDLPVVQRGIDPAVRLDGRHALVRVADAALAGALGNHLAALGPSVEAVPPTQPLRRGIAADFLFVDAGDDDSPRQVAAHVVVLDAGAAAPAQPVMDGERVRLGARPLAWQGVARACALAQQRPYHRAPPASASARSDPVPAGAVSAATARPRQAARILVAEDHPVNRELAQRQLALLGYGCDVVEDGRAACDALLRGDYALLMTDCRMPRMDGYELARTWRRHESDAGRPARLPIIAMTAHALDGEIDRCREAGMDDCLSKPVQLRALEKKLLEWLPQAAADGARDVPASTSAASPDDMLPLLREASRADLDAIGRAVAAGDAAAAGQRLHRLLGALQIFADGPAIERAMRLLDALQDGDRAGVLHALPECLAELRLTLDGLEPRPRA